MRKLGLKLWSINKNYIGPAAAIYSEGFCHYIELFYVPGSMELLPLWERLNIPFVVHAPHTVAGLNPADSEFYSRHVKLAQESFSYAEKLKADFVIFHPGMAGSPDETVRQIRSFGHRERILIENKPYRSLDDPRLLCRGSTPQEMKYIIDALGAGFCLDIGHAICAANSLECDKLELIDEFVALNPKMYHLGDGDFDSAIDGHSNLGKGNYPLESLWKKIPVNAQVTIETDKAYTDSLRDFEADVFYLRKLSGAK